MNDDNLRWQLQRIAVPQPSEPARARARHRALIAFHQAGSDQKEPAGWKDHAWSWRAAVIIVCVLSFLPFLFLRHSKFQENIANDRQILLQTEKLFPDQVNAVVEENGKIDLSISQAPVLGADQPVLVIFKQGTDIIRVLSYSGHRICLMLGKKENCFEVLATPSGGVILEGDDAVWLASEHPNVAGYSVRAQILEASL